jgi:hypothetical protein
MLAGPSPALLRPGERQAEGLERLVGLGYPRWREPQVWRRHGIAAGRSGALFA